ncbi:MAG: NUMOD4 domain-containing protein [Cyclobacteriaceae bacterium]|nr:NUMOD4 domain-containing protein [Cyclobacteriaceae bacterium]
MSTFRKIEKLKFYASEKWETIRGYKGGDGQRYAISNYGRIVAYWDKFDNGYFLKYSFIKEYPGIQLRKGGESKGHLVHRLVAEYFCNRPSAAHRFVIHLDHKKDNNYYRNLKWTTKAEMHAHMVKDPAYLQSKAQYSGRGQKLTIDRVKLIKRKLAEGKTRMKIIAKQFGISEMQLYRIKSGKNWGHVKI